MIAIAALGAGVVALRGNVTAWSRMLSALALAGVGFSLAASGHAATAPPEALTRPAVFLHGIGVAFWLGALAPLVGIALDARRCERFQSCTGFRVSLCPWSAGWR